jgi:hypothetical protein
VFKITIFTGNHPRHIALVEKLAFLADELFVIQECQSVVWEKKYDSDILKKYFKKVNEAEKTLFGEVRDLPSNSFQLALGTDDVSLLDLSILKPALSSDVYIAFGCSCFTGELYEFLIRQRNYCIHMGVSPYYYQGACNFWAMYNRQPEFVGATVQLLAVELDSGPMLFHAFPKTDKYDPFMLGMKAVEVVQQGLLENLQDNRLEKMTPVKQDPFLQKKHALKQLFTAETVQEYLSHLPSPEQIKMQLETRDLSQFICPYII